ncbi:uncharacterized protein V1518DRAFT_423386 [Limtongia smithiae]|uniref:uncharacterized protein n=1 Tax=Limtongia smithiae TaxID=1125753 RepID=UPI0034CEFE61
MATAPEDFTPLTAASTSTEAGQPPLMPTRTFSGLLARTISHAEENGFARTVSRGEESARYYHSEPLAQGRSSRVNSVSVDGDTIADDDERTAYPFVDAEHAEIAIPEEEEAEAESNVVSDEKGVDMARPRLQRQPTAIVRHGFFSKGIRQHRKMAMRQMVQSALLLGTLVIGILSLYWGSYFNRTKYYNRVSFWVINMDDASDAEVGPAFVSISSAFATAAGSMQLEQRNASDFGYSYETIYDAVVDQQTWGAFIVASNATTALRSALDGGEAATNYTGAYAIEFAYPQGREYSLYSAVIPWVNALAVEFQQTFAGDLIRTAAAGNATAFAELASTAPNVLSAPASVYENNLRPFSNPIFVAVLQVGIIYLIIISFFQFNFFQPVHMALAPHLKLPQYIIYRLVASFVMYFVLSLFYSLISLAFQVDFTVTFGRAGFVVYWMINFIGMSAVGGALENVALIFIAVAPPLVGFWLIFIVISNVSVAFYSIPLMPGIYKYGYAFPIKHVCDALKTILLGTKNTMGLNVGVIFCWIAVNTAFFPVCLWLCATMIQKKKAKEAMKAAAAEAAEQKREEGINKV